MKFLEIQIQIINICFLQFSQQNVTVQVVIFLD